MRMRPLPTWVLALALFLVSLLVLLEHSDALAPAFSELPRLDAVLRSQPVVYSVAAEGLGALVAPEVRDVYASLGGRRIGLQLLSAWSSLSIGRLGWLDTLTSARLPALVLAAGGGSGVFLLGTALFGRRAGLFAALLLLSYQRYWQQAVVGNAAATIAAAWTLSLAAYVCALRQPRQGLRYSLLFACAIGIGAAFEPASLYIILVPLLHFPFTRAAGSYGGRVPVFLGIPLGVVCAGASAIALNPSYWGLGATRLALTLLEQLTAERTPTLFLGVHSEELRSPFAYVALLTLTTTPAIMLAATGLGVYALVRSGPPTDSARPRLVLGSYFVLAGLLLPSLGGPVLVTPPRAELVAPVLALCGGYGVAWVWQRYAVRSWLRPAVSAAVVSAVAVSLWDLETGAASFNWFSGGPARVHERRWFEVRDGSELGPVARAADGLGRRELGVSSTLVPPEYWSYMRAFGRMQTSVRSGTDGSLLVAGRSVPGALVDVRRGGAVLWSLGSAQPNVEPRGALDPALDSAP